MHPETAVFPLIQPPLGSSLLAISWCCFARHFVAIFSIDTYHFERLFYCVYSYVLNKISCFEWKIDYGFYKYYTH